LHKNRASEGEEKGFWKKICGDVTWVTNEWKRKKDFCKKWEGECFRKCHGRCLGNAIGSAEKKHG
jgi:hypothetical protein